MENKKDVLGLLSVIFSALSYIIFGWIFGFAGLVLGIISLATAEKKTLGVIGVILSGIALIILAVASSVIY